ncbi:DUF1634 domain-containing protein [Scytonema sp. UIC 10036]|uniref:DUF1634 domain-containing protein n=1 Tax=Scytonema sp. UIC 10036 TaxID=2304196 RepID=UPI0012DA9D60|nr:DUF1634 domain-containing protein [Scytonema sp. UIC 10036]MUG95885.1 DUF1634 domain-containing protein [Scytonema sp. UIC 10036]
MHLSNFHQIHSEDNDERNISESAFQTDCTKTSSEQQFEQFLGNFLKFGIFIACFTVLLGGILYLIRSGTEPVNYQFFLGQPSVLDAPNLVLKGILSGNHNSIIVFGLLQLIAIPVIRVALSVCAFVQQRDSIYTVMTLLALSGLIYSFIAAY